jgi:hypothetical protein
VTATKFLSRRYPAKRNWKDEAKLKFFACVSMRGYAVFRYDAVGMPRQIATAKTWAGAKGAVDVLMAEYRLYLADVKAKVEAIGALYDRRRAAVR